MGCNQGRQKPQKLEVQPTRRTREAPSRILQMSACLPFVATLHSGDGNQGFVALWEMGEGGFVQGKTYTGVGEGEGMKGVATLLLEPLDSPPVRLLFLACTSTPAPSPNTRENEPHTRSLIHVWDLHTAFDRGEELREFGPGEELQAVAAGEECVTAVSAAWLYVWNCRMTGGGRKSVYRNPVFTLSFQMSLGRLPSPSMLSIQTIDGSCYPDLREKSRLCVCAGVRREASPPNSRHSVPFAVVVTQEESEMAHRVQVVDLKANVSKEFTLATATISSCRLLPDSECLIGVYTERYHCEIWRVSLSGDVVARISFQTSSKRLSLNPLDKFMSEKAAQMASPKKKGKFSSPIIEMVVGTGTKGSTVTVVCADGYIAVYSIDGFRCEGEFRVNLMCDTAVVAHQSVLIGDKTGHVHKVTYPGKV